MAMAQKCYSPFTKKIDGFRSKRWQWLHLQTSSPRSCLRIGTESCHRLWMELPWIRKWAHPRWIWQWFVTGLVVSPHLFGPQKYQKSALGKTSNSTLSARHDGDFPGFRRALGGLRSAWPVQPVVANIQGISNNNWDFTHKLIQSVDEMVINFGYPNPPNPLISPCFNGHKLAYV